MPVCCVYIILCVHVHAHLKLQQNVVTKYYALNLMLIKIICFSTVNFNSCFEINQYSNRLKDNSKVKITEQNEIKSFVIDIP